MKLGQSKFRKRSLREDKVSTAALVALLWIGFLGFLPVGIAMVVGLIQGTIAEEVTAPSPGYPAFPVLSLGMTVPAALIAFAFVRSFTWPLKSIGEFSRGDLAWVAFVGLGVTMVGTALDTRFLSVWAARVDLLTAAVFFCVSALALLRIIAGWLRLVPRSWREEKAKPTRRRRS